MKNSVLVLKRLLAEYARRAAEDNLTVASSGNISARIGRRVYIKAQGVYFERAKPADFITIDIYHPNLDRCKLMPSYEYRFHIACYKKRPEINAVLHTHPITATTLYSAAIKQRPITLEFMLYIGERISTIDFITPGSRELAQAIEVAILNNDAIVMRKHGLLTVGRTLQEAYLRTLIIEREAKAQFICRLFKKPPPYLTKEEINSCIGN